MSYLYLIVLIVVIAVSAIRMDKKTKHYLSTPLPRKK